MGPGFFPFLLLLFSVMLVLPALVGFTLYTARTRIQRESLERGRELLESGQPEEAARIFERLTRTLGRNTLQRERALYWLARSFEQLGREDEARVVYRHCLEESATRPFVLDGELEQLMRDRLLKLGAQHVPARGEAARDYWARFKEERDRAEARGTSEPPRLEPTSVAPRTDEPVSPERLASDEKRLAVGRRVGSYVLAEKLGEGGFGEVYRALKPVAIKLARDPTVVEHLRRFGTIQGKVTSDRVVKPLEINLDADPPYVVMELVDGFTLRDLLLARKLEPPEAIALMREVALALKDAHEQGVLHLDLKPENVLLDESGKVKLTDFDLGAMTPEAAQFRLSKSLGSSESDGKIAGTIAYMSPEQRDGKVPDQRSDVYTFGVLLFEALTGEHPQPGDKPSELLKGLAQGAEIDKVFERCFTRLERRYATASELARDLEPILSRLPRVDLAAAFRAAPEARARVAERARAWEEGRKNKESSDPVPVAVPAPVPATNVPSPREAGGGLGWGAVAAPAPVPVPAPVRAPIPVGSPEPAPLGVLLDKLAASVPSPAPASVRPPIVLSPPSPEPAKEAESREAPERRLEPSG